MEEAMFIPVTWNSKGKTIKSKANQSNPTLISYANAATAVKHSEQTITLAK
jgi:hypothetical protein